jgi:carboxylesterase
LKGCLFIHGFTGSPYEIEPLAEYLRSQTDWRIYTPTLAGHGKGESLRRTTWKDWVASAEEALADVSAECEEVYVIGFSMGGVIAGYLASRHEISKLILLSPAVYYPHTPHLLKEFADMAREFFNDQEKREALINNELQKYKQKLRTPIKAVYHFSKLVKEARPAFRQIDVPVLVIQGEQDRLVNPKSAYYVYESVQSPAKEIVMLEKSRHVLCHDCEKELVFQKVDEFLQKETHYPTQ